ncbi:putative SAUR-like auxin-responsive protein family [Hibiscus syriacus]|uniref:SAUR-like auxin-responsive protein family n=1 Tax=Hibiscus syriacus TaxID=106335 RepID=A0A6A3BKY3_HIBSY|nr:putative SAUR-like auxin-responsive protein family [Hibiscus syriacus]
MAESKRGLMMFLPFFEKLRKRLSSSAYGSSPTLNQSTFDEDMSVGKAVPGDVKEGCFAVSRGEGRRSTKCYAVLVGDHCACRVLSQSVVLVVVTVFRLGPGIGLRLEKYMSDSGVDYGQGRISTLEPPFRWMMLVCKIPFVVKLSLKLDILRREVETQVSSIVQSPISSVVKLKLNLNEILLTSSGPFVVKLNLRCLESNILRCEVEIGSEIGKLLLTSSGPFVVKLNLHCLESNIIRCEVEIGSAIGKLLLTSSGPFVVKLNLRCLKSNILRCEVEIGSEIEKLLLTSSGPFVVKLNLRCLECHDILRRGVEIADGPFVVKLSLDLNFLRREVEIQVLYVAGGHNFLRREVETVETPLL